MATMIPVNKSRIKQCDRCTGQITFVKNRNGKWFPVDVFWLPATRDFVYRTGIGSGGNLTPWHRCNQPAPVVEKYPVADPLAERKAQFVARHLELVRAGVPSFQRSEILVDEFPDLG